MSRRTRRTLLIVAAVLLLLAVAIFLRSKAPPEAARLLPESDGIVYFNLKAIRTLSHKDFKPPNRVPEYQQFIDAIGIDPERDLDQVAIALHRMPDPNGPNGPVAYSMVLVGKITGQKLNAWLDSHATSRETYVGHTIYSITSQDRTVRVAQIGYDMVAVSNTPTTEQIHSMLDRHRAAALPFAGSSLLERHFHDVPLLSLAWGVGQIGLPFSESGSIHVFGLALPLEPDSTIIASVAPALPVPGSIGALRFKVEEIAPSQDKAASQAADLATLVTLTRGLAQPLGESPANDAFKELLNNAEVAQHGERVIVTATLPASSLSGL
ncbi:MAG: hypothetical protein ABR865_12995 [Terracidiphilus sp.]|jgi:hypothetical protein